MFPARGFTLMELMLALAIAAILAAIAIPSYVAARASVASTTARAALQDTLTLSLRASVVDRTNVVTCSSANGQTCSGSPAWESGWIVFLDRDRDRQPDPGATLLKRQSQLSPDLRLRTTSGRTRIVFQPHGGASAGSNATFTLCDRRGAAHSSTVILANSGRIRMGVPSAPPLCP